MLTRARPTGPSLVVVDVAWVRARGVLEWHARQVVGRLGARGRRADGLPRVLLHVPPGHGPGVRWPAGARVVRAVDRLSSSQLRNIHERVFARSFELIRGPTGNVFPEVCGVSLGALNLETIQMYLASFGVLSTALDDLLGEGAVTACHIVSADVGFAGALERQVAGRANTISTWPPRRLLELTRWAGSKSAALRFVGYRRAEQAARGAMAALLREQGPGGARPRVLIVSQSTPLAQTFDAVEGALAQAGIGPVMRLDFCAPTTGARESSGTVCRCGAPGALGFKAGLLRAQWSDVTREIRSRVAPAASEVSSEAPLIEGLVGRLYESAFDVQARHLWAADTALELLQPDVVVVGPDQAWESQAFVQLARRRGIPSLSVQDGVAGDVPWWWSLTADRLAATSQHLVQMLVRHGVPPERCRVTGQPRYDFLARSGPDDQRTARAALGLDPSTFAVLFAAQWMHGPDYVWGVLSALLAVPGIHVMLRPHPSDPRDLWERLMREHASNRMTLHRAGDSFGLVRACDALVTQHSTVVLEAALLGKPVIIADFGGRSGSADFVEAGIATAVRGLEELTREVQRLVSAAYMHTAKPARSGEALDALLGPVDGRAGERVAILIAKALQRTPRAAARRPVAVVER